jgi:sterol desaturase/sphingolipid hydroxylase (fatty acid hydroxylase superfamily)
LTTIFKHEATIRLGFFLSVFGLMALWEWIAAKRKRTLSRWQRWPHNIGISIVNTVVTRILAPAGAVGFAEFAHAKGWGVFNMVPWPPWDGFIAFLLLDLAIYLQHRAFHYLPVLWRLHRMHHADLDVDVTTGARFHPIEIALSLGIKFAVITALGASPWVVLVFEIALNATSMLNHSNVRMPDGLEKLFRCLVPTPDMHRIHHSIVRSETDSNFGFNLPWWDWLFRTYRAQPEAGHEKMTLGIEEFREPAELRIDRLLLQPFRDRPAAADSKEATSNES